ncbi:MAG: hypothetical protein M0021_10045 [Clostridia bacterium]|nr:hypothetical protein [Clostridia bacterium]
MELAQVQTLLADFLGERWKGNRLVLWGDQVRQAELAANRSHGTGKEVLHPAVLVAKAYNYDN